MDEPLVFRNGMELTLDISSWRYVVIGIVNGASRTLCIKFVL